MKNYTAYCFKRPDKYNSERNNRIVLYNVIFPIWLLWLLPVTWLVVLPGNFLIDLIVLLLTIRFIKLPGGKEIARKSILKIWISGFVSDFIGTAVMLSTILMDSLLEPHTPLGLWWYENLTNSVALNPFETLPAFLWTAMCIFISGFFIYLLNYRLALKKAVPDKAVRRKLALSLAVFTAPYMFLLPTIWFYK